MSSKFTQHQFVFSMNIFILKSAPGAQCDLILFLEPRGLFGGARPYLAYHLQLFKTLYRLSRFPEFQHIWHKNYRPGTIFVVFFTEMFFRMFLVRVNFLLGLGGVNRSNQVITTLYVGYWLSLFSL